jgi:xylulokinase
VTVLVGVDLGAQSLKVSVVRPDGTVVGEGSAPVLTATPHTGWAEQNPDGWIAAFDAAVPAALAAAGVAAAEVAAIGLSAGAHIGVLCGEDGRPLRPALLWSDGRAAAEAAELRERAEDRFLALSLNRPNPTWLAPQLVWLARHEPEVVAATRRVFLAKDYLRHHLTGTWETDWSDVVGALLGDAAGEGWSAELCRLIGWDPATLPPVVAPTAVVGGVRPEPAARCGLRPGTPVVCGSNDTTVELFGCGATEPDDGAVKLATAGVTYQVADGPLVRPPISCYPHIVPGRFYTATGTNSCASAHRWVRDLGFASFEEMDGLAAGVAAGSDGLLFHPYLQGERAPHWDPQLRASFTGMTIRHGRAHLARATYEGIAFSIVDALRVAEDLGIRYGSIRLLGGGARSATWRQILADVLGKTILVPRSGDASFGAALVAGIGVGVYAGPHDAVATAVRLVGEHAPNPVTHDRYQQFFAVYRQITRALRDANHRLHHLTEGA